MNEQTARERKLVILHTNDIHSHFEHMPQIAAVIEERRSRHESDEVLTLDIGDHMDRMRAETEGTGGLANIAVLNETGYDAVVPGNNEGLTFTREALAEAYAKRQGYAVLCANLLDAETGSPPSWMEPCRIFERSGLTIGLIAVTAYYPDFYSLLGWQVLDPIGTVARHATQLRPQVDLLIVLSHLGLAHDKRIAEEIPGIDLILGGHSHHLLEEPLLWHCTYLAATGCYGRYVGELELRFDPASKKLRLERGMCLETGRFEPSARIAHLIEDYSQKASESLEETVATLSRGLQISWDAESQLGNLLASGLRRWTGAQIGIVNAGQLLNSLEAGDVTRHQLLELCPSPINPCRIQLKGEYIWQAAEESLLEEYNRKPIRGFGFRGKVLGTLCFAGLTVEYDDRGEPGHKIRSIMVDGEPLNPERSYTVGTIDMFIGIGYMSLSKGEEPEYFLPEFIRDIVGEQLQDEKEIRLSEERHWFSVRR